MNDQTVSILSGTYYMPDTVLGIEDITVNKTDTCNPYRACMHSSLYNCSRDRSRVPGEYIFGAIAYSTWSDKAF